MRWKEDICGHSSDCKRKESNPNHFRSMCTTKLELMVRHSMINELFQQLDGIDIHLVEVSRDIFNQVSSYDRGIHAHLAPKGTDYELTFDTHNEKEVAVCFSKKLQQIF